MFTVLRMCSDALLWRSVLKTESKVKELGWRALTDLLGGSVDSLADRPRAGSSVSIMVSLQIIYISPFLLCCPQAHKASFSMLLLAKGVRETVRRGMLWVVVGGSTNQCIQTCTRTAHYSVSTGSTTALLFLHDDTSAAFAYSWINSAGEKHVSRMSECVLFLCVFLLT